jgi:hypothetical protein
MKLVKKQSEERVTVMGHGGLEQRFRYPAHEEISEVSCGDGGHGWHQHDQPADADGPARAIAS